MIRRIHDLHAVFTSEELGRLHQRMAESGVRNRSSFIRKMALDGYIVKLDMDEISEMIRLLRISSNNLNQIAKKINATGSVYGAEIAEMQVKQDEIWELAKEILARLSTIQCNTNRGCIGVIRCGPGYFCGKENKWQRQDSLRCIHGKVGL